MKVKAYGFVYSNTGYAVHSRNFFCSLSNKLDLGIIPRDLNVRQKSHYPKIENLIEKGMWMERNHVAISLSYPDDMQSFCGKYMIGYTVFEAAKAVALWVQQLSQLDEIWVVSKKAKSVLCEAGLKEVFWDWRANVLGLAAR